MIPRPLLHGGLLNRGSAAPYVRKNERISASGKMSSFTLERPTNKFFMQFSHVKQTSNENIENYQLGDSVSIGNQIIGKIQWRFARSPVRRIKSLILGAKGSSASARRKFESRPFLQRVRRSSLLKLKVRISQNGRPLSKAVSIYSFLEEIVLARRKFHYATKCSLTARVLNGWVVRSRLGWNFHCSVFN